MEIWKSGLSTGPQSGPLSPFRFSGSPTPSRSLWGAQKAIRVPQGPKRQSSQPDRPIGESEHPLNVPGSQTSLRRPGPRTPRQSARALSPQGPRSPLLPPHSRNPWDRALAPPAPAFRIQVSPLLTPGLSLASGPRSRRRWPSGVYFAGNTRLRLQRPSPHPSNLSLSESEGPRKGDGWSGVGRHRDTHRVSLLTANLGKTHTQMETRSQR